VAYGGERLDQGRRRERHVSRERIEVPLGQHDVLGERAVHLPSEEAGVTAEVAVATRAGVARATGDDRIEQNRLAGLDARDAVADPLDDAGGFVAHHHRETDPGMASGVDLEVRVAHGCRRDAHHGFAATGDRRRSRHELEAPRRLEHRREGHAGLTSPP